MPWEYSVAGSFHGVLGAGFCPRPWQGHGWGSAEAGLGALRFGGLPLWPRSSPPGAGSAGRTLVHPVSPAQGQRKELFLFAGVVGSSTHRPNCGSSRSGRRRGDSVWLIQGCAQATALRGRAAAALSAVPSQPGAQVSPWSDPARGSQQLCQHGGTLAATTASMSDFWHKLGCCVVEKPQPKKRRRRIDRSMIGEPMNFVHLTHIGSGDMAAGEGLPMTGAVQEMRSKGGRERQWSNSRVL